jgi:hypothetical protein
MAQQNDSLSNIITIDGSYLEGVSIILLLQNAKNAKWIKKIIFIRILFMVNDKTSSSRYFYLISEIYRHINIEFLII